MRRYVLVFAGGFCGTLARYLLAAPLLALANLLPPRGADGLPIDILLINLSGAVALGFLFGLVEQGRHVSHEVRLALGTGFLGAYTTFSTLAYGGDTLLAGGRVFAASVYLIGSIALGVLAASAGHSLPRLVGGRRGDSAESVAAREDALGSHEQIPDALPLSFGASAEGDR